MAQLFKRCFKLVTARAPPGWLPERALVGIDHSMKHQYGNALAKKKKSQPQEPGNARKSNYPVFHKFLLSQAALVIYKFEAPAFPERKPIVLSSIPGEGAFRAFSH